MKNNNFFVNPAFLWIVIFILGLILSDTYPRSESLSNACIEIDYFFNYSSNPEKDITVDNSEYLDYIESLRKHANELPKEMDEWNLNDYEVMDTLSKYSNLHELEDICNGGYAYSYYDMLKND
jgi:hypothetical protein